MHKGYLKLLLLKQLSEEPNTGLGLIKKLEVILQKAPSTGSIYPLLAHLQEEGHISFQAQGRKKIYSLTTKGKLYTKKLLQKKQELTQKHVELLNSCCDQDAGEFFKKINFESPEFVQWMQFKALMVSLVLNKDYEKKKVKINNIMQKAIKQLKLLK